MTEPGTRWTPGGVRLRPAGSDGGGPWNWLFVPGGPGVGSESLAGLAAAVRPPGTCWLVDLPGDGSNRGHPAVPADPFRDWPRVLAEAATGLDHVIMVGHSTGGMFILATPELEGRLRGLVLVDSARDAAWRPRFEEYARIHPLPGLEAAAARYADAPGDRTLRDLTVAAAAWNFTAPAVRAGTALLAGMPYANAAVEWADAHFDRDYRAAWTPAIPTLIVSGRHDHIVDQRLWAGAAGFSGSNVTHRWIEDAGHFPWIDNPHGTKAAFADWCARLRR